MSDPYRLAGAARWLLHGTLLVPLVVSPGFMFPFVTIRAVYFRAIVELCLAILAYFALRRHVAVSVRRDVVFWTLLAWLGANALAAVFGAAPMRSIFGDHERMGGVWFWVHMLAYYVLLRAFFRPEDWWRFFRLAIGVAAVVAAYGLVQSWYRPFSFGIKGIEDGVTIGNGGLLAAYLLANVALCVLLATRAARSARIGYFAVAALLVVALVFTGNRSSTLALLVGTGAGFVAYAAWSRLLRSWRAGAVVALFAFAVALPFLTRAPWARPAVSRIPALSRLSSGVDSSRVVQWRAAVDGIRDRPLLGFGPENYRIIWTRFYHPEMERFITSSTWDRAHNAYLDAFATAGVLGFLSLLAIWLALGWSATCAAHRVEAVGQAHPPRRGAGAAEAVALGFFAGYAFYLFFWFFDLNSTMLWIALAAFVASRADGEALLEFGERRERRWQTSAVLFVGAIALVAVLYVHGLETLKMARNLDRVGRRGHTDAEILRDYQSVFASPAPVTQHAFPMYASYVRGLYGKFRSVRNDPASAAAFDNAFVLAIKEFERQAVQDPMNETVAIQHARVLMIGAYYYGSPRLYESALRRLQRAVELAPRKPTTHLALGAGYLNAQRPLDALTSFEIAYGIYPPFAQTHAYLGAAYAAVGSDREAARWLASSLESGYLPDRALVLRVARALSEAGDPLRGAELVRLYLYKQAGPAFVWGTRSGGYSPLSFELATIAAELFARGGDSASALVITSAGEALCQPPLPLDRLTLRFAEDLEASLLNCRQPWREARAY